MENVKIDDNKTYYSVTIIYLICIILTASSINDLNLLYVYTIQTFYYIVMIIIIVYIYSI